MTLPELLISMVILGLMSVVLAGMSNAVNSAWAYTKGVEVTELQATAALDRIKFMVLQTGAYRVTGQPPRLGMGVVTRSVGTTTVPDVLVLWTGGRNGGMSALGTQARLPVASELLIYTWDVGLPNQFSEVAFPGSTTNVDFAANNFGDTISTLLASSAADRIPLCDRLRVSALSTSSTSTTGTSSGGSSGSSGTMYAMTGMTMPTSPTPTASVPVSTQSVGNVRFGISWAPTDVELAGVTPGTAQWYQVNWPQGVVGSRSGMRQATLSLEVQIEPDGVAAGTGAVTAIPFFDSGSVRYVYE